MLPSAEAVVAMVNEGWAFETLMAMPARRFGFWLEAQRARNEALARKAKAD